ncbi:VCBS repeat-containing protein [candidate division KSB1 bacterium]|nr:VCBS repeat-containing protein [candidate division KSB1 bacterium]
MKKPPKSSRPLYSLVILSVIYCLGCTTLCKKPEGVPLASGERIAAGGGGQPGPIAPGLQSSPVGRVFVFDHAEPDLFVMANRHSLDPGPGLYLYEWTGRNKEGVPVFAPGRKINISLADLFSLGISDTSPSLIGSIFQMNDGSIHGWWLIGSEIYRTLFDKQELRFKLDDAGRISMTGLPDAPEIPTSLAIWQQNNNALKVLLSINDGVTHRPDGYWRAPGYIMYDGAGVFLGKWPHEYLYISDTITPGAGSPVKFHQYSLTKKEALHNYQNLTLVEYEKGGAKRLITGTRYGLLLYYPLTSSENAGKKEYVTDESGIILRHKAIAPFPISYINAETRLFSDLIVGGECELIYYPFSGKFNRNGAPIYREPFQILQQNATLYTGTLPVINTMDWDNNGRLDIVSGNSEGRVLLFLNDGTNESPSFSKAQQVKAGGRPIHIQLGYTGSVQGPAESRWGYTCPTVTDWNGDGLFDILMHSAVGRHEVYLNIGKPGNPEFDHGVPIYCEGLELHGTWRVQPGVKKLGEKMAHVILDDDDEFHIYRQIDAYNVEDGGKLHLDDGSTIKANFLSAGGTGRLKIVLEDWDLDGKTDMLVGTPRHGSVPDAVNGLPQSKGLKGASVLFLKNIGADNKPVFAFPKMIRFKGEVIYLGQHACSPEVWDYGQPDGPDLLIGEQDGRIRFYKRKDLNWDD